MRPLPVRVAPQPDDETCGATCLEAIYRYYEDPIPLLELVHEVPRLENGGTLGAHLANHALARGYRATIFTYNLEVFDPTWFREGVDISAKLQAQRVLKGRRRLVQATSAYLKFLASGGLICFEELSESLIRRPLEDGVPILTGLSATYLYGTAREDPETNEHDDVGGEPVGHFVLVTGYDAGRRSVLVADPLEPNPVADDRVYEVSLERLIGAIGLGLATYDANLVVISPKR